MPKVSTNISLDADLKKASQELYADLGMDLTTAVTIFLKQSLRVQGLPFIVTRENPNAETVTALNEYYEMKAHPEKYKRYSSFRDAINEVLGDAQYRPVQSFQERFETHKKRGLDFDLLEEVVDQLAKCVPLPEKNRDHALTGDYIGFRECHVAPDWLLIYRVEDEELELFLFRTGTHSDLFT